MANLRTNLYRSARVMGDVNAAVRVRQRGGQKVRAAVNRRNFSGVTEIRVGYFGNRRYPNGRLVAEVAAENEFGGSNRPPRPFFARTNDEVANSPDKSPGAILAQTHFSKTGALTVLPHQLVTRSDALLVVQEFRGALLAVILDSPNWAAPLSPLTVQLKGHDHPLIESGLMATTLDHLIRTGSFPIARHQRRGASGPGLRSLIYWGAKILGDAQAITQGNVGQRIGNRAYGKFSGRTIGAGQAILFGGKAGGQGQRIGQRVAFKSQAKVLGALR